MYLLLSLLISVSAASRRFSAFASSRSSRLICAIAPSANASRSATFLLRSIVVSASDLVYARSAGTRLGTSPDDYPKLAVKSVAEAFLMQDEDMQKYADMMKEIKDRTTAIAQMTIGMNPTNPTISRIESIGLQFRKIFELVAFSSLVANREKYSAIYADFSSHWEASKLIKNLRRINPDFCPEPVTEEICALPGVLRHLAPRASDYLTEQSLVTAHGRCGALMHSTNPFGTAIDYGFYHRSFQQWMQELMNLLNIHKVRLVGEQGFYLFHMREEGHNDVRFYRFDPQR